MSELQAGRELDALVAEKVMGFGWFAYPNGRALKPYSSVASATGSEPIHPNEGGLSAVPGYSTDIAAAWEVVEKMGGIVSLKRLTRDGQSEWYADFGGGEWWAETAPLAICRAAMKAVEGA